MISHSTDVDVVALYCDQHRLFVIGKSISSYEGQSKITESWFISFYWVGSFS